MIVEITLLVVGLILVVLTALYVAAEFALVTVDRATVTRQAADGNPKSKAVLDGLTRLSTHLSGAQIGITVTTLGLGFVMQPSLASLLNRPLLAWGLRPDVATSVTTTLALIVASVLSLVYGELVPKNIAIAEPLPTAQQIITPMRISTAIFSPLIWFLNGSANLVLKAIGIQPQEELRSARSSAELASLVRRSGAQGTLGKPTAGLLARTISLSGKVAEDAMTPRVRVHFVTATDSAADIVTISADSGHSRFPVCGADDDDVLGLVHLKHALAVPAEQRRTVTVAELMRTIPVVPGTIPLDDLLITLRENGHQMAVVADEYGGTDGIVTLEDIVEELVGEITDEHDSYQRKMRRLPDQTWLLEGTVRPDEVAEQLGIHLPEDVAYETVAGLLVAQLGHLATVGDSVSVRAIAVADSTLGARSGGQPLQPAVDDDLPRSVLVSLRAVALDGRRIEHVQLSSVDPQSQDAS